jgi:transcriptional regulator with XRE-family HTH domain
VSRTTTPGSRIKLTRTRLGLSPQQLADRVGVTRKSLENWENDRSEPRGAKIMKLAGVLQVPMIWLLTGDTPPSSDRDPTVLETTSIAQKLDRAVALQRDLAALLIEVSADLSRLQRDLDEERQLAA